MLPFHVGVGDLSELTGHAFDREAYRQVRQFIFIGELDTNDTLPYDDAYSEAERELTRHVLGHTMTERWERAQEIYRRQGVAAEFVTYPGGASTERGDHRRCCGVFPHRMCCRA
jgi:hypothetical protein